MSKIPCFVSTLFCALSLFFVSSIFGDTITLKTGEHLEGKITAETDKDVTIQVQISAGITDERVVPKAQIEKVDKISPEVVAYRQIAAIQLGRDSMTVAQYDPYIRALKAFVDAYPGSVRTIDVQKVLNDFTAEKKRVEAGEIKMNGQWLSIAEVAKQKVEIGAELAFSYMKGQSAQGDFIGALNTFAAIEKNFPGAVVMPEAIDLAQKDLVQLEGEVKRAIPDQKAIADQHKTDLAAAGPADRAVMAGAIKRQLDAEDASVQAASNAWPPFYKDSEKSLSALVTKMNAEGPRLAALPVEKMKESLKMTNDGKQSLSSGDVAGGVTKLKEALGLWPANEFAQRLLKEATDDQKAAAATPVPTAAAATPAPATPKMRRGAPMPQAAAATETAAASAPASSAPAAAPATATTTAATTQEDSGDSDSFITMPRIIMAVALVALLAIGGSIMKKKKRQAEEA